MDFAVKQEGGVRSEKILSLGKNAAYFSYDSQGVENRGSEQRTLLEAPTYAKFLQVPEILQGKGEMYSPTFDHGNTHTYKPIDR